MMASGFAGKLKESSIPGQHPVTLADASKVPFPLVLEADPAFIGSLEDSLAFTALHKDELTAAVRRHGAVLIRDLPGLKTARDFDAFNMALGWPTYVYVNGAAPRTQVFGSVYTTNEGPADTTIAWHNEVAQSRSPPARLIFSCELPAQGGSGSTGVLFGPEAYTVLQEKHPEFLKTLESQGVVYTRRLKEDTDKTLNAGRGWKDTFNVSSKEELQKVLDGLGITGTWLEDGSLLAASPVLKGVKEDPATGQIAFFNSICGAYFDVLNNPAAGPGTVHKYLAFGPKSLDGSGDVVDGPSEETLASVYASLDAVGVDIPWREGDLLLVDNHRVAHQRRAYHGPRKVFASLWN